MNLRPYRPIRGGRDCVGEKFNHFYSLQMSNQNNTNVTTENAAMDESFKRHSPFSEYIYNTKMITILEYIYIYRTRNIHQLNSNGGNVEGGKYMYFDCNCSSPVS